MDTIRFGVVGSDANEISALEIGYYLESLSKNYGKIIILSRLLEALEQNPDIEIELKDSIPIYAAIQMNGYTNDIAMKKVSISDILGINSENGLSTNKAFGDIAAFTDIPLTNDEATILKYYLNDLDATKIFLKTFNKRHRPEVYIDGKLLYDYFGDESLKIKSLNINSPIDMLIEGSAKAYVAIKEDKRNAEKHEIDMKIKNVQLETANMEFIRQYANTLDTVSRSNINPYVKEKLEERIHYHCDKITELNYNVGVDFRHIDVKA